MTIPLHAATIAPFLQILTSVARLIDKAERYCRENTIDEADLLGRRLHPDMLPLAYQLKSTAVHSIGAVDGVREGRFSPDRSEPGSSFHILADRIADAQARLSQVSESECESFVGKAMRFEVPRHFAAFTGDQFLLHFSLPNFHFHATTAYAILRAEGLSIGKVDYLGPLSMQSID